MGKGKQKMREAAQEPMRGFPDAFDQGSSSDSGLSAVALTSRDKGKGRADPEDEDEEDEINTMWQSEDGRSQWLARLSFNTTFEGTVARALRHLHLRSIEEELPRIVHVRQEGREVPIEDEFDFDALKRRALASDDPLYPVIIRVYTSDGATPRRRSMSGTSRSISPAKPKTPLSNFKRSILGGLKKSPGAHASPRYLTGNGAARHLHKNQQRRKDRRKKQSQLEAETGAAPSRVDVKNAEHGATPAVSTSKRRRPSSPTSSTLRGPKANRKKRKRFDNTPSKVELAPPASPDSNIRPALREAFDVDTGRHSDRGRPVKPSPLADAHERDPPNEPQIDQDDDMDENEPEDEDQDQIHNQEAVSEADEEEETEPSVKDDPVPLNDFASAEASPVPQTDPISSPEASSPSLDRDAYDTASELNGSQPSLSEHEPSEQSPSRTAEQPSDDATSVTSHRSPSKELDVPAAEPTGISVKLLSPRQLPPSARPSKAKPVPQSPPHSTSPDPGAVSVVPDAKFDSTPATSPASALSAAQTHLTIIELTKPAWNLFRKPASPIFTAAYSSSSINTPPEGSAQYRKRTRKSHKHEPDGETSTEPSAFVGLSEPHAKSSALLKRKQAVEVVPEIAADSKATPIVLSKDLTGVDESQEQVASAANMKPEKVKPTKKPPTRTAQVLAKQLTELGAETPADAVEAPNGPSRSIDTDSRLHPATKATSSTRPSAQKSKKSAPLVEAARSKVQRSPIVDELDVMEEDVMDIDPSLRLPDFSPDGGPSRRIVQTSPSSRDANSVEDVVGDKIPTTAQASSTEDTPAESSKSPESPTHHLLDLAPEPGQKRRRGRRRGRLEGIDLDIEDKEMDGLDAAAQRAKLAGRGVCMICRTSPMHLQKDCPKVKAGVETLRALLLQRQAEAEAEQVSRPDGDAKKTLKNGLKAQISEETQSSIETIEGWIHRLTAVRNRVMGLEVNVEKSKSPIKELTTAEELDALSAQSTETAPKRSGHQPNGSTTVSGSRQPADLQTASSTTQPRPSHLPPLLQKALAKPRKAGSTSGVSASDALIETGDSGSDSDSEASDGAPSEEAEDSASDQSSMTDSDPNDDGSSHESMEDENSQPDRSVSPDDGLDLDSFMKRPPTKDQIRRARISAASMLPIEPPSVALDAESVDDTNEDEELYRGDSESSIGDFEGVESHKADSERSRSVIETHTPPPVAASQHQDIPDEDGAVAEAVTGADQSTKSNRSFMALHDRASSSPVVDIFAGARALQEAIEAERTPASLAIGLPSPPVTAKQDLPATQLAQRDTSSGQAKGTRRQPSFSLAPAAEISPGKQSVDPGPAPKSPSVKSQRNRSTSRSSAIIQAHRDALLALPNGRSRLNTSSSPETRLKQFPSKDSSPETTRKRSVPREVVVELPSMTRTTRMSLVSVSEQDDTSGQLDGTSAVPAESPRMATRSTPRKKDVEANGMERNDRMRTPERSVAPSSSASSNNLHLDFNSGLGVKTPVQSSPRRIRKTRSSQVNELESSQPVVGSSSTVKRELATQQNGRGQRSQPNGTSQASVTSSRRRRSSLADGVSDSYPDTLGSRLRSGSSQKAPTRRSPVFEASQEGSEVGSDDGDDSVSGSESDDDTMIPSQPPTRPPVALHRRAESQQIINPIPSLSQLPTEMLRNGSLRSHLRSSAASQPTPTTKRLADSESESEGDSDVSSSEEDNMPPEKRGRMANGRKPKQKTERAFIGW